MTVFKMCKEIMKRIVYKITDSTILWGEKKEQVDLKKHEMKILARK